MRQIFLRNDSIVKPLEDQLYDKVMNRRAIYEIWCLVGRVLNLIVYEPIEMTLEDQLKQ